jgi:hypothetical protein
MFEPTVEGLLNIQQFCQRKFNKITTRFFRDFAASSWYDWKALNKWDFLDVIYSFRFEMEKILNFG